MPDSPTTLLERWEQILAEKRNLPALFSADGNTAATFAEVEAQSETWARALAEYPPRSVVGLQLGNHLSWPAILLAIWRANQIALPLDATLRSDLAGQILENAGASALITANGVESLPTNSPAEYLTSTDLCKVTSGTTGTPRLIEFSMAQLLADSDNICATMGLGSADVNFAAIPFSHSYGFSNLLTPLLTQGIPVIVTTDFLPQPMIQALERSRATILPGIPLFYQTLTRLGLTLPVSVRLCITAGAPLRVEIARAFHRQNQRKIHSFYGASECGGICYDDSDEIELPEGFVGHPLQGVELVPSHEPGRIIVKSRAVGNPFPKLGEPETEEGTFHPADLLEITPAGYRIVGRLSDFINMAGKKLDPQTIESVIEKHPAVSRAIVIGVPHPERGETPIAVVESASVEREEVLALCRKSLAPWQIPSAVWRLDHIPVSERGKVNRRELAEKYLTTVDAPFDS